MRIGFFTDGYLPQPNGVSTSVYESAKELERRGHEVTIIAPKYPGFVDKGTKVIRLSSVKVHRQPEMRIGPSLPDKQFLKVLGMDFDLIHGHSGGPITLLGWEIARNKKIPFVLTYHTLWNRYTHYFLKGKIVSPKMMERATKIFGNRVDSIIAPTKRVEKELKSYGVKRPINVIPSGIDTQRFIEAKGGVLRARLRLKNEPVLLYVGRLGKEKSVDFIIRSFKKVSEKIPEARLVLVGDGNEKRRLENLSKKLKLTHSVFFLGDIKNDDIAAYYKDADVFVFASTTETQGLVVPEALCSGVPVVTVDDPAFDCVRDGENGFLVKKDEDDFSSRIVEILANKQLKEKLSQNAVKDVSAFSVKTMVDGFESIYYPLLDKYNKEGVYKIMNDNEKSEQAFVISLTYWITILATRVLVFLFYKPDSLYPQLGLEEITLYQSYLGIFLMLLATSLFLKKRSLNLFALLSFGVGLAWFANEAWSSFFTTHTQAFQYWDPVNAFVIFAVGVVPLLFIKIKKAGSLRFYIGLKQPRHENPKNPKVSVVIPAYNEAGFIDIVLKSLINQTYKDFELIVVDNNSTDETAEVAKKYGARVVKEKTPGVAAARQAGFMAAVGDIIATTDSDSVVPENWVEKIVEGFGNSQGVVAFGGLSDLYSGPVTARAATRYLFPAFWIIDKYMSGGWNLAGFNLAVRREAFRKIGGFKTSLTMGEDIDLAKRLREVGEIRFNTSFDVFVSGRRYRKGLFLGVMTYAPSWFMRVFFRQDKFLTFPAVRSEKIVPSAFGYLPLGALFCVLLALFYLSNNP